MEQKANNINNMYDEIMSIIDKLYKEYDFLNLSQKEFYTILKDKINYIYNKKDKKENKENYQKQIEIYIKKYIKEEFLNSESSSQTICNYINKNIVYSENYENNLKQLNKISGFLSDIKFIPNPDLYIEIINSNTTLQNILKSIVNENIKTIENNELETIIKKDISISFIQTYCMINNINQDNNYDDEDVEKMYNNLNEDNDYTTDIVKQYFKQLKPQLPPEEERNLAIEIRKGNTEAKDIFIERNLRLVVSIAKRYLNNGLPFLDLIQEGNIGLMKAVDRYDVTKGFKFSTYATHWIRQSIKRGIENNGRNIRVPSHLLESINKYKIVQLELQKKLGREPNIDEIAEELRISYKEAVKLNKLQSDTISMNKLVGEDEESELEKYIPDVSNNPENKVLENIMKLEIRELLEKCNLKQKEIDVLKLRYGLENEQPKSLQEIGDIYNVSRERIRQIENKALAKIRRSKYVKIFAEYTDDPQNVLKNISYYNEKYDNSIENTKKYYKEYINTKKRKESSEKTKEERNNKMKKLKTIYEYLNNYSEEEINKVIAQLDEKEKEVIKLRYGNDLYNPQPHPELTIKHKNMFYNVIIPKMKLILETQKNTNQEEVSQNNNIKKITQNIEKNNQIQKTKEINTIAKEDYVKMLELLKTPVFEKMRNSLADKEALIISLKFGYIDGKCFSTESIANFLGIDYKEVNECIKKSLLSYKKLINNFIDEAINTMTDEQNIKKKF